MPIPTEVTEVDSFEIIEKIDVAPPGSDFLAYVESGLEQLSLGNQVQSVTFTVEKAGLGYVFDEFIIYNHVDVSPIVIGSIETRKSTTGFEFTLTASPDTGNYYLRWKVRIPTTVVDGVVTATTTANGSVTEVSAVGFDGIHATVSNATTAPTVNVSINDGGIPLAKLEEDVLVDDGTTATLIGAEELKNKSMDGNENTFSNIPASALSDPTGLLIGSVSAPAATEFLQFDPSLSTNGLFRFTGSPTVRGINKQISLALRTDGRSGRGTPEDPINVSTYAKMDTFVASITSNMKINLGPGTFSINPISLPSGVSIDFGGAGIDATKLVVRDQGSGATNYTAITLANYSAVNNVVVHDMTIDCNLAAQSATNIVAHAVHLDHGNTNTSDGGFCMGYRLKAIGWGNKGSGAECFVIYGGSANDAIKYRGPWFFDCEVTSPANVAHGTTGTTCFDISGGGIPGSNTDPTSTGWMIGGGFVRCTVHNITVGTSTGQVRGLHGFSPGQSAYGVTFDNCRVENITGGFYTGGADTTEAIGFYLDTGATQRYTVRNCYVKCQIPFMLNAPLYVDTVIVHDNDFICTSTNAGQAAIYIGGNPSNRVKNFIAYNNRLTVPAATPSYVIILSGVTNYDVHSNRCIREGTYSSTAGGIWITSTVDGTKVHYDNINSNGTLAKIDDGVSLIARDTRVVRSIVADIDGIHLSGDSAAPGNSKYYGTNGSGTLGYYDSTTLAASDAAFDSSWNGSLVPPSKNAIWDGLGQNADVIFRSLTTGDGSLDASDDGFVTIKDAAANVMLSGEDDAVTATALAVRASGTATLGEAANIVVGTSTGSKIGTATGQKLAFHGSTAVIQRASADQAAVVTTPATNSTPYGYSQAQADAIVTLLNEIRAALVAKGLIKGSA